MRVRQSRTHAASGGVNQPSPEAADPAVSYLADLLSDTREELSRIDSKASLLLAAAGVVAGTLIAGLAGSDWTPLALRGQIQWLWWTGVAAALAGIGCIAASVHPRVRQPRYLRLAAPAYYGDVAAFKEIGAFRAAIEKVPDSRERLINQTFWLSRIVHHKYVLVQRGLWCLLGSIVACGLAIAISALLAS